MDNGNIVYDEPVRWYKFTFPLDAEDATEYDRTLYIPFGVARRIEPNEGEADVYLEVHKTKDMFNTLLAYRGRTLTLDNQEEFSRIKIYSRGNDADKTVVENHIREAVRGFWKSWSEEVINASFDDIYDFMYDRILVMEFSTVSVGSGISTAPVVASYVKNGWIGEFIWHAAASGWTQCRSYSNADLLMRTGCGFYIYEVPGQFSNVGKSTAMIVGGAYSEFNTTMSRSGGVFAVDGNIIGNAPGYKGLSRLASGNPGQQWPKLLGETSEFDFTSYSFTSYRAPYTQEFMPTACSFMYANSSTLAPFNTSYPMANTMYFFLRANKNPVNPNNPMPVDPQDPNPPSDDEGGDGDGNPNSDPVPP